ncbi:hypothetical protein LINPERHAP1_LOCUS30872 [Linum perenne]
MERDIAQLSLEEDDDELFFSSDVVAPLDDEFKLCLVGFLLMDKPYNFTAFQSLMASRWRPGRKVHDLPVGFYLETVGKVLGNFTWRFVEYDASNLILFDREFMRLRVTLDVRKPLKREKKIRVEGGESITCRLRYERLPNFCYIVAVWVTSTAIVRFYSRFRKTKLSKCGMTR